MQTKTISKSVFLGLTALVFGFAQQSIAKPNAEDVILSEPGLMPSAILEITDEPGHWFKDPIDGDSLVVIKPGEAVLLKMTDTRTEHTITSLLWPSGAAGFPVDQEKPSSVSVTTSFDKPGLYVFTCKVHPYVFGAVVVDDPKTKGLDIGSELQLITGVKVPASSDIATKLLRTFFVATTPALWRDYSKPTWNVELPDIPLNIEGKQINLTALNISAPNKLFNPVTPGI
jgi:hypothetical protein